MDVLVECSEVVWVEDDSRLVDAESYERTYAKGNGKALVKRCYYVAHWPAGTTNPHFLHEHVMFDGPYGSRREAEAACITADAAKA